MSVDTYTNLTVEARRGAVLEVHVSGKLTKEDYEYFLPAVEQMIREHGKVRIILIMRDFHGWTAGALWEDLKFDFKHFGDIERLAFVGDRKWERSMAVFCKPFTRAVVRYFDLGELSEAREWVWEGAD